MGIYIQCFADAPSNLTATDLAAGLAHSARSWVKDRDLEDLFYITDPDENGVWLTFYPPMGGIRFRIANGRVQFDAKTSVAGPGFHAALIDLCDRMQRDVGVQWRWDSGGDQTGYAVHRNMNALADSFVDQFIAYCDFYKQQAGTYRQHALNLAEGVAMDGHDGVATPLGPLPLEFFLDAAERETQVDSAKRVFPWWDLTPQTFWRDTLRALLWTEVEWRAPRTQWETFIIETVQRIARRIDMSAEQDLGLAVAELAALSAMPDEFKVPAPTGIGYLRHMKGFFLPGPWRINLPGYYIEQSEDNGGTVCLWFGSEEIRGSSMTVTLKEGASVGWSELFADSVDRETATCAYRILAEPEPAENADGFFTAWAEFHAMSDKETGEVLLLSLFDATPSVTSRLEAIAKQVWFNPPVVPAKRMDA